MGSALWLLSGLAVVAAPLPAETPTTASGPPPRIALVGRAVKADMVLVTRVVEEVPVMKESVTNETVGGRVVPVKRAFVEFRPVLKEVPLSMKGVVVYDTEGKVVQPDTYWPRLKAGAAVLVSANNKKVDPAYLKCIRPETLILVLQKAGDWPVVPERIIPAPIPVKEPPQ